MGRIIVDPVTRIEGHLRVDVEVAGGLVRKSWSSAQMFRGIETIVQGRDPKDVWTFTQRFCGVCTTVHATASIRAVEDALNLEIPKNALYVRNMVSAAHQIQDFIVHFYHLSALDWVDISSCLKADPAEAVRIANSYSGWSGNSFNEFKNAKDRLAAFVKRGKLGIFGTGYDGHPAMKLPPAVNLIAFSHYLKALDYQRLASQYVGILGGKEPHIQNLCVGGVATAINMDNTAAINMERLALLDKLMSEVKDFVNNAYVPDVLAIASFYPEWLKYGGGEVTNFICAPDFPLDSKSETFQDAGGVITGLDLRTYRPFTSWKDPELRDNITENTTHAWYKNSKDTLHPHQGETNPSYTDSKEELGEKYSWCKAPRYKGVPHEVGPLAEVLIGYAAKEPGTVKAVDSAVSSLESLTRSKIPLTALHSTLGRHLCRALRTSAMADRAQENMEFLKENLASGDKEYCNPMYAAPDANIPADKIYQGVGFYEATRGMLSHWIVIDKGVVGRYQAVVPSTWNAGPKDEKGAMAPYEASLIGNPVADEKRPLEVIRTIHSFDPCIACAVHTVDPEGKEITKVTVN